MRRLAAILVALAALAPPARAAEVSVARDDDPVARYLAAPGEANALRVEHATTTYVFYDRVPLTAGTGCTPRADGAVVCSANVALADLGDGDDVAQVLPRISGGVDVMGGPGADTLSGGGALRGGAGDDVLTGFALFGDGGDDLLTGTRWVDHLVGGSGTDVLRGRANADRLSGDGLDTSVAPDGPPEVVPAPPAPDVVDGGPGGDTADYQHHRVPVRVDLTAPGGGDGEDTLTGIEHVTGGSGDDTLLGDARDNRITGADGRNTVAGRGGDDQVSGTGLVLGGPGDDGLHGGRGDDRLVGGPGADQLSGHWGHDEYSGGRGADLLDLTSPRLPNEVARCGGGRDTVVWMGLALLLPDCERAVDVPAHPSTSGGRLTFTVPASVHPGRGRIELVRLATRRRIAVARFDAGGRTTRVPVTVPRRLRGTRVVVRLRVRDHRPEWPPLRRRWVIDLPR